MKFSVSTILLGFAAVAWYSLGGQISDAELEDEVARAVDAKEAKKAAARLSHLL